MKKVISMPDGSPKKGEVYKHYKQGDLYKVVDLALHSNDDEWMVVYKPMYESPYKLFTRPLREWSELVEWQGKKVKRFSKT